MNRRSFGLWVTLLAAIISGLLDGNWELFAAANIMIVVFGKRK